MPYNARRSSNYHQSTDQTVLSNTTTPRLNNRLSLPSIGAPNGSSSSSSGVSSFGSDRQLRRTNPAQEYFNDVGMVLDSDDAPEITEWDYRTTPRQSNANGLANAANRQQLRNSVSNGSSTSRSSSMFPISRSNLLSSRSGSIRPSLANGTSENGNLNASEESASRNDLPMPSGSSEFSQVLSEIYSSPTGEPSNVPPPESNPRPSNGHLTSSVEQSRASQNGNQDRIEIRNSANRSNLANTSSTSSVEPRVSFTTQARTANRSVPNRPTESNEPSSANSNATASSFVPRTVVATVPVTDTSEFDVPSVDDVLTRLRRQNDESINRNSVGEPTRGAERGSRILGSNRVTNSHTGDEAESNASSNRSFQRELISANRVADTTRNIAGLEPENYQTPASSSPFAQRRTSTQVSANSSTAQVLNSRSPNNPPQSSNQDERRRTFSNNESVSEIAPRRSFLGVGSTSNISNSVEDRSSIDNSFASSRNNRDNSNMATSGYASMDREDSSDQFQSMPSSQGSQRRDIRSVLRSPPSRRNQIFDDSDTPRNVPPVRTARASAVASPPASENSDDDMGAVTPRPRFVTTNRIGNRIGVRFTSNLDRFATSRFRASEDTTIFSSDDSDENDDTNRTGGPRNETPNPDTIPHLNAHVGIMQLLGLDLPQSTTEVILLNQRSILEQLLETYISLMVSLQSSEPQAPVGLTTGVIDKLPRESIIKQQVHESLNCSICLANFEFEESATKLPECTHLFHHPCITHWLQKSPTCPLCRTPVTDEG